MGIADKFDYFGAVMSILEILFWALLAIVFYTYIGYGLVLFLLIRSGLGRKAKRSDMDADGSHPSVVFIIAAYNEQDVIGDKIRNTRSLDYPADRFRICVIADGSNDDTVRIAREFPGIEVLHVPERKGKAAAMNRSLQYAGDAEVLVFSDANTVLDTGALKLMMRHYADPRVGAVSGEKKVMSGEGGLVQAEGESIYWRYESLLKKWDSQYHTVVGAAGELFSLRRSLYTPIPESTILDDFFLSLKVCEKGYVVTYEPEAVAMESASSSIRDEKKRKARISAGAFQAIGQFPRLLFPYPDPRLTFQYVSHRLMRWVLCPFALPLILLLNIYLVANGIGDRTLYGTLLAGQCLFYLMALVGWLMSVRQKFRIKIFYIPFYFLFMNYSVWLGLYRYLTRSQSSVWDKAQRMQMGS
jgi:cellulose synthase/poly-beta-1,6-N-acetylglucosamine synthase-like glycosyltransferase